MIGCLGAARVASLLIILFALKVSRKSPMFEEKPISVALIEMSSIFSSESELEHSSLVRVLD